MLSILKGVIRLTCSSKVSKPIVLYALWLSLWNMKSNNRACFCLKIGELRFEGFLEFRTERLVDFPRFLRRFKQSVCRFCGAFHSDINYGI